ncbi:MAG: hypothetical protein B6D41_08330 [Chloroflexi bacterium UTCFX4]|nr:MAG: hypothetical protein B6D41_08330 [Chloroflexi bacterium UTCFX4]
MKRFWTPRPFGFSDIRKIAAGSCPKHYLNNRCYTIVRQILNLPYVCALFFSECALRALFRLNDLRV